MTRRLARIRLVLLLAVGVLVAGFGVLAYGLDMFRRLELDSVDARFSIRDEKKPPPGIVMVAVDTTTFSELDRQWPFPRSVHAAMIRRLDRDGAKVIAYDVQLLSEPTNLAGRIVGGGRHRALLQSLSENEDIDLLAAEDEAHGKGRAVHHGGEGQRTAEGLLGGPGSPEAHREQGQAARTFVPIPQGCCAASRMRWMGSSRSQSWRPRQRNRAPGPRGIL